MSYLWIKFEKVFLHSRNGLKQNLLKIVRNNGRHCKQVSQLAFVSEPNVIQAVESGEPTTNG
jgi:hypothetical protein